jgi:hypothetical protein
MQTTNNHPVKPDNSLAGDLKEFGRTLTDCTKRLVDCADRNSTQIPIDAGCQAQLLVQNNQSSANWLVGLVVAAVVMNTVMVTVATAVAIVLGRRNR